MVLHKRDTTAVSTAEGVERTVLVHGGSMMAVQFQFTKGSCGAVHTHPHEQVGYVVKGRLILEIEGVKAEIAAGDSYYVEPNVPHGVTILEATILLDVFTPQRMDFLAAEPQMTAPQPK